MGPGAVPPGAWADAPRIVVDADALVSPAGVVGVLHGAWAERRPVVVELAVDPDDLRAPERYVGPVHALEPGFTFWRERLQFLVWANAYDARDGEPVWWHGRKVARRLADDGVVEAGPADVSRPDGTPSWVDGGPPDPPDTGDGTAVVHRWTAEAGRLTPSTRPRARRRPGTRPAGGRRPRRRPGPGHRPRGIRQDPGADRAPAPPHPPRHRSGCGHRARLQHPCRRGAPGPHRGRARPRRPPRPDAQQPRPVGLQPLRAGRAGAGAR